MFFLVTEVAFSKASETQYFATTTVSRSNSEFDTSFDLSPEISAETQIKYKNIMKLYVGNLSFDTTNSDLEQAFGEFGTVESANVVEDRDTGRSRGFGFVEMSSKEEGENAIEQLNGTEFNGRNLTV
ncbi:MAG TPA: RNA-binding protein, partial [Pyrinomonadaceae bacterium]|nr:RNA-binding protein [Pyrinomonadaceae bacterium]